MRGAKLALVLVLLAVAGGTFGQARSSASSTDTAAAQPANLQKAPVVMVLFDEFPTDDLRLPDGRIDSARFPNFARFAKEATWYDNSRAVHDSTPQALPAIMDGRLPKPERRGGTFAGHPHSIFSLLGGAGWKIANSEVASDICGERYCPGEAKRRKGILQNLAHGRPQRWFAWIKKIHRGEAPTLHFKHALLPHLPWIYLPHGQETIVTMDRLSRSAGFGDPDLVRNNHARHLLQVGYADHLLGGLMERLKRDGLYNRALIVLTADHGVSFDVGVNDERKVTSKNIDEIAPTPFFIKAPGQTRGVVDPAHVSNIDVVPTMASILDLKLNYKVDGRPASSPIYKTTTKFSMPTRNFRGRVTIGYSEWLRRRAILRRRKAITFGTGATSKVLTGSPWGLVYAAGPNRRLMGRRTSKLHVARAKGVRGQILQPRLWRSVNPRARRVPTQVAGYVFGGRRGDKRNLVVAVNGHVEAVGRSFHIKGDRRELFSMIVPPSTLRKGRNYITVYAVGGSSKAPRLRPIASA